MIIRKATENDAEKLLAIYAPYVTDTAVSFEYEIPSIEEFRRRIRTISEKYVYLLAENEATGEVLGYCYGNTFHARPAYDHSVETTIYLRKDMKRQGIGRTLYTALEQALFEIGVRNLYACIAYPGENENDPYVPMDSVLFHEKMGYVKCGHFHACGLKFGRLYDMVYMEKILK